MKKITMIALMLAAVASAQSYTTGTLNLTTFSSTNLNYSAKIDVAPTGVTLTLIGPSTSWLGIGFNASGMGDVGMDCVIFDGSSFTDRRFNGVGVTPPLDAQQNWTLQSNTVSGGVRTVIGTRALNTGDPNDYVFTASASSLTIAYARRAGSTVIGYHGGDSCGSMVANFTLGTESFTAESVKLYPNPSKGATTFELPSFVASGEIKIYDSQGRLVKKQPIEDVQPTVSTEGMPTGVYMAVVRTEYGNVTKNLLVE